MTTDGTKIKRMRHMKVKGRLLQKEATTISNLCISLNWNSEGSPSPPAVVSQSNAIFFKWKSVDGQA